MSTIVVASPDSKVSIYRRAGNRWIRVDTILPSIHDDGWGSEIRISSDGTRLLISSPEYDTINPVNGIPTFNGRVMIYDFDSTGWNLTYVIEGDEYDYCGSGIAMTSNGNKIAISYPGYNGSLGMVVVYEITNGQLVVLDTIIKPIAVSSNFGSAIDISGDGRRIVIGDNGYRRNGNDYAGIAFAFEWDGTQYVFVDSIGGGTQYWEFFGEEVAISGNGKYVAIGASHYDSAGLISIGRAVVYMWTDTAITFLYDIKGKNAYDYLGKSIDIDSLGYTIAIGVPGDLGIDGEQVGKIIITTPIDPDTTITIVGCDSVLFSNKVFYHTTILFDTLNSSTGCDSIIQYNIVVQSDTVDTVYLTGCSYVVLPQGTTVYQSGMYSQTLSSIGGCDSTIRYIVTIFPDYFVKDTVYACDSFISPTNKVWYTSGIYYDTLTSTTGCDSIVEYYINISHSVVIHDSVIGCDSILLNTSNGQIIYSSGVYSDTLQTVMGCDSIVVYNVIISQSFDAELIVSGDTLIANPTGQGYRYRWFECQSNGTLQSVVYVTTNNFYLPQSSGLYAVEVSDSYAACVDTSECQNILVTSVMDGKWNDESVKVKITREKIYILWKEQIPLSYDDIYVALYDVLGRKIEAEIRITNDGIVVDANFLSKGVYNLFVYIKTLGDLSIMFVK